MPHQTWVEIVLDASHKPIEDEPRSGTTGLRVKREDGSIVDEEVTFYIGLGWLTEGQYFEERQRDPRGAP